MANRSFITSSGIPFVHRKFEDKTEKSSLDFFFAIVKFGEKI